MAITKADKEALKAYIHEEVQKAVADEQEHIANEIRRLVYDVEKYLEAADVRAADINKLDDII